MLTRKAVLACREHGVEPPAHRRRGRGQLAAARAGPGAVRRRRHRSCASRGPGCAPTTARWSPPSAPRWSLEGRPPSDLDLPGRLLDAGHPGVGLTGRGSRGAVRPRRGPARRARAAPRRRPRRWPRRPASSTRPARRRPRRCRGRSSRGSPGAARRPRASCGTSRPVSTKPRSSRATCRAASRSAARRRAGGTARRRGRRRRSPVRVLSRSTHSSRPSPPASTTWVQGSTEIRGLNSISPRR